MTLSMWNRKSTYFGIMERENPKAVWASGRWRLEQKDDLAEIFAKFLAYRCVQVNVVLPESSVPWFQLSTVCRLWTDWITVSITVNHNVCLGEIYIAIPRQLVDTKKTVRRLYLTVLDFSLLQRITCGKCMFSWNTHLRLVRWDWSGMSPNQHTSTNGLLRTHGQCTMRWSPREAWCGKKNTSKK